MLTAVIVLFVLVYSSPIAPDFEGVTIETSTGGVVTARYVNAGPGAPGTILFPICRADAVDGWRPVAERLREAGVSSLTIVYRGYAEAAGQGPSPVGDQRVPDTDAAFAYLRSRIGPAAPVGVTGSSCGVNLAFLTASRHPADVRAVVALAGPHTDAQLEHVRQTPQLAVFSGASRAETPAVEWATALQKASANGASRLDIIDGNAHGTDNFTGHPGVAQEIAEWLVSRLKAK
jgi:alpha-beta hydrolase superfamily lysophospholipase